jgi:short subunit dehydrogenase-like uncharacterized protein
VGDAAGTVATMTVAAWYRGGGVSRGTLRSFDPVRMLVDAVRHEDGAWTTCGDASHQAWRFSDADESVPVAKAALPPVITVPRHVELGRLESLLGSSFDALAGGALDDAVIDSLPEGPSDEQRRLGRWTISVQAVSPVGVTTSGEVGGTDTYGTTAMIAVEAARRLVVDGAPAGVLAPSQAFDPASFLGFLADHGVRWRISRG